MTHYLLFVALEWALIVTAVWLGSLSYWLWPLAVVVIGTRQHALAVLGHDGAHFAISKNRRLNDFLAALSFWPFGMGLGPYREFHFLHHKTVGTSRDPEMALKSLRPDKWIVAKRKRILLTDLCGGGAPELMKAMAAAEFQLWPNVFLLATYGTLIATGHWQAVVLWLTASLTVFWASFRQRMLEEHIGPEVTLRRDKPPAMWRRLTYLPHHIWKHWEHHRWPAAEPWNL